MKIKFDKLYRYERKMEPCSIAIPVKAGQLWAGDVTIKDGDKVLPSQTKITSRHKDGSVRYLFTRFLADLPGNAKKEFDCELGAGAARGCQSCATEQVCMNRAGDSGDTVANAEAAVQGCNEETTISCMGPEAYCAIQLETTAEGYCVDTGALKLWLKNDSKQLFERVESAGKVYTAEQFTGPVLQTDKGVFETTFGQWKVLESGCVCAILEAEGHCSLEGETLQLVCRITVTAGKPWMDVAVRLVNTTDEEQHIASLVFGLKRTAESALTVPQVYSTGEGSGDSTGCGDAAQGSFEGGVYRTTGVKELPAIEERIDLSKVRTCVGRSNYKTFFTVAENGKTVSEVADALLLKGEANEHMPEVFYGTFFADVTDEKGGVCATVFQAQQNFPKAVTAGGDGICVMLVPEGIDRVVMASGMAREQRFQLHFHDAAETLTEIDNRSLIYQMPDTPHLAPEVFKEAGVMPDIFVDRDKMNWDVEIALVSKADGHSKAYGMMNWGDAPDSGYTDQGRGKGKLVWTNNEYDYPHGMYLLYARTGTRRFLDFANVAASHWMDVDVCHYSKDPLRIGGQWEHTYGHCGAGVMVCSHEWVEGLIDCYHFTGNERALQTALGIGENILRLLETPMYQVSGESNARETGWALRTLTALYVETWDEKWTEKCRWIVGHFKEWIEEYGEWVAPYTDNTSIRVGFMISVAVGSLMRYYRVFPEADVREMMLSAIDDLVDNCLMDNGLFYYKELPSLARNGTNTLLLEAMAIGYELTGEKRYLEYGLKTFERAIKDGKGGGGGKRIVEDAVLSGGGGTKGFAQSFLPLTTYYKALTGEGMI